MHLQYSNQSINSDKVRFLIRAGSDLTKIEPKYYYEIEQDVLPSLVADRILVAKLLQHRKSID